jgi:hypothetical protein
MALDTRLIGQAIGGGRPLDLAGAVRPAVARGEQAFARTAAKKAAHQKAIKERGEFSAKLIEQFKMPSFKGVPTQAMGWLTEQSFVIKNNVYAIATNKDLNPTQQQILINEQKENLNNLTYWSNEYKESTKDFIDKTDMLSEVNTEQDLLLDQMRVAGEYKIQGDKAIFNINNNKIEKPISELSKGFNLIEQDHIAYNDLLEKVNNVAKKTAAQGKNETALDYEIQNGINNLKLTDMQYLTLAVDKLGFTEADMDTIRKEAKDENPDKIDNQDLRKKVIQFVENNVKNGAKEAYAAYFTSKDPKDPTAKEEKTKRNEEITLQTFDSIINNPIKAIEQSGMPDKTEVKNNKITFYTPGEDGAKTINGEFDLKSKEGIKALAKYIASYDYKSDTDLIYKINNYDITDDQINEIQKSFLPNPVDPFNPNN